LTNFVTFGHGGDNELSRTPQPLGSICSSWQEEILLGIKDDMFAAEQENAIGRETRDLRYILFYNWNLNLLNNGMIFLEISRKLQNLL
jgi:hypothetical protein